MESTGRSADNGAWQRMQIGYLTYGLDRAPTGIGRYAVNLLLAIQQLPDAPQVTLLTTERDEPVGLWHQFPRQALPYCRLLPTLATVGNIALSAAIKRHKFDIVHDPFGIAPFLGPRFGAQRIVTVHDTIPLVMPEPQNKLDYWRFRTILPAMTRVADHILTVSTSSKTDLMKYLHLPDAKIRVVYCGVEERFFVTPDDEVKKHVLARYCIMAPFLLYLGGLNERKNVDRLLEAFARIRDKHPQIKLVLGGKGFAQNSKISAAYEHLGLGDAVHFTGYVEDADLPALYSAAEAFVFPSLYEGFGIPPLEAMSCGTPTLTANTSSLPEVVGGAALTVNPYDVAALASGLDRILSDTQLRMRLRVEGPLRAASFTWAAAARQTVDAYKQLLNAPSRHA